MCDGISDIGFLLDSSGSLRQYYSKEKDFLKILAGTFGISKDGSHAGVISFSSNVNHDIKLSDHEDITSFNSAVDKIPHMNQVTRIDSALKLAQSDMFSTAEGGRVGVPKVLILITDGAQYPSSASRQDVQNPAEIAEELRASDIVIIVVGIGQLVQKDQLVEIAGKEENVFLAKNFDDLISSEFLEKVKKASCEAGKGLILFGLLVTSFKFFLFLFLLKFTLS